MTVFGYCVAVHTLSPPLGATWMFFCEGAYVKNVGWVVWVPRTTGVELDSIGTMTTVRASFVFRSRPTFRFASNVEN